MLRHRVGRLAFAAVLALGSGCAQGKGATSSPRGSGSKVTIENRVTIRFTGRLRELPFDPREIRLRESSKQVAALAGHDLEIIVDVALMPEYEAYFHEALIDALQSLARDLEKNAECECEPWLPKTIAINYAATATRSSPYTDATLDKGKRTLTIPTGARTGLVPDGLLDAVLEDARGDYMVARYAGKEARDIATADHREYFEYLRHSWYDLQTGTRRAEKDGDALRKAVELHERTADEALRGELREYATGAAETTFPGVYWRGPLRADSPDGDLPRAAKAYGAFVAKHERALSDEQKLRVAKVLYVHGEDNQPVRTALPGVDAFAFGLRIIDRWIARGATYEGTDGDARALLGYIVCHQPAHSSDGTCRDEAFYKWAWGVQGGKAKLAAALVQRKRKEFVEAAMYAIDEPLELWRLVEDDATTWRMVTTVIGEEYVHRGGQWVPEEVERLWRERPRDRGQLLFLLARSDPDGRDAAIWDAFSRRYGARPTRNDFAGFLDASVLAWTSLTGVFKALAPGFSRADVIAAKMDAFLEEGDGSIYGVSLTISGELCTSGTAADRATMHRYWTRHLRDHASQRNVLTVAIDRVAPGGCD